MKDLINVGEKTDDKIKELQELSLAGRGSLMAVIRSNIKNWELNLKPVCVSVGKSYHEAITEILAASGYVVEKKRLSTCLNRAKSSLK